MDRTSHSWRAAMLRRADLSRVLRFVRRVARGAIGPSTGTSPPEENQERFAEELRRLVGPLPWCVDDVIVADGWIEIRGWAIPPGGETNRVSILVDGMEAATLDTGISREDVALFYWFLPGANRSGFHARHRIGAAGNGHWRIDCVDRESSRDGTARHRVHVNREELLGDWTVPSLPQIERVHGGNSQRQYQIEGYSAYVTLERVLHRITGHTFGDFTSILDFGCGCGRLARYFRGVPGRRLYGVDLDRANVEWCQSHLAGQFLVDALRPPLALPAGAMDCVVAHDVFPHFREADGLDWLRELGRVSADGAILLITIASGPALARARLSAEHHARVRGLDVIDLSANHDLDGVIDEPGYYRNVFHSHDFIRRRWSAAGFRVLDIVAGVTGSGNDVAVLEREVP